MFLAPDSIDYSTIIDDKKSQEQDHKVIIKELLVYNPTSMYLVDNEQKFIFTTEAPFILQCNNPYDLWFCDINKNEIQIYSFIDFKGYKGIWESRINNVYNATICGKFGCYEGYGR